MPDLGEIKLGREIGKTKSTRYIWVACKKCNKTRWVACVCYFGGKCQYCHKCASENARGQRRSPETEFKKGNRPASYKGGRAKMAKVYIGIRIYPDDFFYPMANSIGYVLEHRLVVAKALNRCLLPWETVHHKEGYAKDDNRYPETLELLPSPSRHDALGRMIKYIRKLEREIERLRANEQG